MHNYLVIQMARMGDFIQTLPLLNTIKNNHPRGMKLWVMVDMNNQNLAENIPCIDEVIGIDVNKICDLLKHSADLVTSYRILERMVSAVKDVIFDRVFNVNYSCIASGLAAVTGSKNITGSFPAENICGLTMDEWFVFFNTLVRYPRLSPFNIVDFFKYLYRPAKQYSRSLELNVKDTSGAWVKGLFSRLKIDPHDLIIVFQIAARNKQRRWPVHYFAQLTQLLISSSDRVRILVTGAASDLAIAEKFFNYLSQTQPELLNRVHSLVSKTSVHELAMVLKKTNLLVTCDTGTMHVAAAVSCPVLSIFTGPARADQTGPYGSDHWAIQAEEKCSPCIEDSPACNTMMCRQTIKPSVVHTLIQHIVFKNRLSFRDYGNMKILKSCFDQWGVYYKPVLETSITMDDIRNFCYREIGKTIIDKNYRVEPGAGQRILEMFNVKSCSRNVPDIDPIISSGFRIMHNISSDSLSLFDEISDCSSSFWHPWIDFYSDMKNISGTERSKSIFIAGLKTASDVLSDYSNHVSTY